MHTYNYMLSFLRRIGWKLYFYENSGEDDSNPSNTNYGFKSILTPPPNNLLNGFQNTIYNILKNIKFTFEVSETLLTLNLNRI